MTMDSVIFSSRTRGGRVIFGIVEFLTAGGTLTEKNALNYSVPLVDNETFHSIALTYDNNIVNLDDIFHES